MEMSGQPHALVALPPGKSPCYPLERRLCGPQSRSGRGGEEKNSQPLQGHKPPIIQPVGQRYTAELSHCHLVMINIYISTEKRVIFCWLTTTLSPSDFFTVMLPF
jgi:hypothetical protein